MTHALKIAASAALLMAGPLSAKSSPDTSPQTAAQSGGPGDKVCEDIIVTGSRLATKRFCGTRAQWADRARQDRDTIEKAQRDVNIGCTVINTHTGSPAC